MTPTFLRKAIGCGIGAAALASCSTLNPAGAPTTFFITSSNPGQGGNGFAAR